MCGNSYNSSTVQIEKSLDEATVANEDNGNYILDKLESTIEMIKHMISESADMTRKEVTEWGKNIIPCTAIYNCTYKA